VDNVVFGGKPQHYRKLLETVFGEEKTCKRTLASA
jgi:hypothetical protein